MAGVQLFPHSGGLTRDVAAVKSGTGAGFASAASSKVEMAAERLAPMLAESVDIAGAGHSIGFAWNGVLGATAAELGEAGVTLYPAVAETVLPDQPATASDNGWRINVPSGARVRALGLHGFEDENGQAIVDAPPADRRIVVAFPPPAGGGFDTPRFAVPAVGWQGAVPPTLTGASFAHGALTLSPAVAASRVRIALVEGGTPSEFVTRATALEAVQLVTHTAARNARLTGPDEQVLWQLPEFDPDAEPVTVDLRQALQAAFNRQLQAGEPLQAHLTLSADAPARCTVFGARARGSLVRRHEGIASTVLEGDAVPLAAFEGAPLADETPASAIGDLTIRYDGLRVLEEASDPTPAAASPVQGAVVGAAGIVRGWPPAALLGRQPARIGVYGRAPEACELALELVELNGEALGAILAGPALLKLDAAAGLRTHWAVIERSAPLPRNVGLRLRCNVGRFFWAARSDGEPLVRVAVFDPDPGGRPLLLGAIALAEVREPESHQTAFVFPAAAFRRHLPWLQSTLFLHVDCSDLSLRYARS
jgi:hypothetical protein